MSRKNKHKLPEDEGVNYSEIKRELMLRDTGGDMKRFRQRTVESRKNYRRKRKHRNQEQE